jgi:protein SCO1/2
MLIAVLGVLLGGLVALVSLPEARLRLTGGVPGPISAPVGKAAVGGPFNLVDHTGQRRTEKDYLGKPMLVFFGFTHCPDVCPSGLQVISAALDKLGPRAKGITPLFITLDPARDTPEKLAAYIKSFHSQLVGLTGSEPEAAAAAKAYRVYFKKVADAQSAGGYTLDHSSIFYVMDRKGEFHSHAPHTTSVEKLATLIEGVL